MCWPCTSCVAICKELRAAWWCLARLSLFLPCEKSKRRGWCCAAPAWTLTSSSLGTAICASFFLRIISVAVRRRSTASSSSFSAACRCSSSRAVLNHLVTRDSPSFSYLHHAPCKRHSVRRVQRRDTRRRSNARTRGGGATQGHEEEEARQVRTIQGHEEEARQVRAGDFQCCSLWNHLWRG